MKTIWLINQYASTPETGYAGRQYYLARGLESLGYRVYVIAASFSHLLRKFPEINNTYEIERREGVNMVWVRMPPYAEAHSKGRVRNWFLFGWRLIGIDKVIPGKPDVIIYSSPSLLPFLGAERLAKKLKVPIVFEVRDIWPLTLSELGGYSNRHPFILLMQWVENRAYKNSFVTISNLKNSWKHMIGHGLKREKFRWLPNGIFLEEVESPAPLDESVKSQIPEHKFVVGYTGTLGVANCMETLIDAAECLHDHVDVHFVLVGDGRERQALERRVQEKGLDNVTFTGALPKTQMQSVLNNCDAVFLGLKKSSLFEFGVAPNKLYEYLYAGRPILYAIESGDYHPIAESEAGLEVHAEDSQALAQAIITLYNMPKAALDAMGQRGRELAVDRYNYNILAKRLVEAVGL